MKLAKLIFHQALFLSIVLLSGCAPKSSELVKLSESSLQERQLQTKSYDTIKEGEILAASVATLQDMGFKIDEINRDFGVITCSKTRDAREVGEQVGLFLLSVLGGVDLYDMADHIQVIRATVVTVPKSKLKKTVVRLTVQRVIYNHKNVVIRFETIKDPEIYKVFYDKLSKSVFLEAHNL